MSFLVRQESFRIFFFLWRNGEPFQSTGWTFGKAVRQMTVGIVLTLPLIYGISLLEKALRSAGLSILIKCRNPGPPD